MEENSFQVYGNRRVIFWLSGEMCEKPEELILSPSFRKFLDLALKNLQRRKSPLLQIFGETRITEKALEKLIETFLYLTKLEGQKVPQIVEGSETFFRDQELFNDFVEYLYNYWRHFERFVIVSDTARDTFDQRPYRTFNETIERLTHLVRGVYRDIQEHITYQHPRVYRQAQAGADVAAIASPKEITFPGSVYDPLQQVPIIRQVLLYPPLVLEPPNNKRTGQFQKVEDNPFPEGYVFHPRKWICYPAKVGELTILVYFHETFFELGFSLCNLFQLAGDEDLKRPPDGIYLYGLPEHFLSEHAPLPTVFYDDQEHDLILGAVPDSEMFGYFGYLKKMILTQHNVKIMKKGRLPFHGALASIYMEGKKANVLIMGESGAGKSETLEALRVLGQGRVGEISIIADDMGSVKLDDQGCALGYGTEIGAFVRLDDLQPGYAFGQIGRAIFMSPSETNARALLPVNLYNNIIKGEPLDIILYANNYQEVDESRPVIEQFSSPEKALEVFRAGRVMSKGTTTSKGLIGTYFANIFGAPQYKNLHEEIAKHYFESFFEHGLFVGELRTRLGLEGWEQKGPAAAAECLLDLMDRLQL